MKSWCRRSFLHVECYWQIMETLLHTFCYSWKAVLWWSDILAVHAGSMAHSFTHFAGSRHRISYSPTQQGAHVYTYHIILSIKCLNCTCIHIPILYYPWGKNSLEKTPQRSEAKQFQEHFLGHESTASCLVYTDTVRWMKRSSCAKNFHHNQTMAYQCQAKKQCLK